MEPTYDVWVVMARGKDGRVVPTSCAQSEAAAYHVAREAVELASLMLSRGATQQDIEETKAVLDSIKVVPARLIIER